MEARAWVDQWADEAEVPLLVADGFDAAILGIGQQFNRYMVVYDEDACLAILMERDGMSYEEAREFFEVNVVGAWVGEATPLFLTRVPREE